MDLSLTGGGGVQNPLATALVSAMDSDYVSNHLLVKTQSSIRVQLDGSNTQCYSRPHPPNMPIRLQPSNTSGVGVFGLCLIHFRCYLPTMRFAHETANEWKSLM